MTQYMLLLGGVDRQRLQGDAAARTQQYVLWTEKLMKENRLRDAHKLKDGEGRRLHNTSCPIPKVMEGPFTETKETVGGYYIIEADNYEQATAIARECPVLTAPGGYVEIRLVER